MAKRVARAAAVVVAVVLGSAAWAADAPAAVGGGSGTSTAPGEGAGAGAGAGASTSHAADAANNTAAAEPSGFWTGAINSPVPRSIAGGKVIHARGLAKLLSAGSVVVVDVSNSPRRPDNLPSTSTWVPVPHPAIKGAIWIPGAGLGEPPAPVEQYYRERLARATGNDLGRTLVIYCHRMCWLSWNGAKRAI